MGIRSSTENPADESHGISESYPSQSQAAPVAPESDDDVSKWNEDFLRSVRLYLAEARKKQNDEFEELSKVSSVYKSRWVSLIVFTRPCSLKRR